MLVVITCLVFAPSACSRPARRLLPEARALTLIIILAKPYRRLLHLEGVRRRPQDVSGLTTSTRALRLLSDVRL